MGKATSFYDPEQDGEVAGKLVTMLANAGVAVPDWLEEAGAGGGGGSGETGGEGSGGNGDAGIKVVCKRAEMLKASDACGE